MESDLTGGRVCAAATVPHANHTPPAATQGVWVFRPVSAGIGGGGARAGGGLARGRARAWGRSVPPGSRDSRDSRNQKGVVGSRHRLLLFILCLKRDFSRL